MTIFRMSTLQAPPQWGRRDAPPGLQVMDETFWDSYDSHTLIYDAVWLPSRKRMRLYAPKLLSFFAPLGSVSFKADETQLPPPRIIKHRRYDVLEFPCRTQPAQIQMQTDGWQSSVPVNIAGEQLFAGRNVLYTMLCDDDLRWVADWAHAHHVNHNADAVLIANNGSTGYDSTALLQTLAAVPGITAVGVLDAPVAYGPKNGTFREGLPADFLQTACLNIVRDRFLQSARAVLNCDVDELVNHPSGLSIFDATARSIFKYKPFSGTWRYAPGTKTTMRHADHIWRDRSQPNCPDKYCIVPNSIAGRMSWAVHNLENINRRLFRPANQFQFLHCHGINTSWKNARHSAPSNDMAADPATQDFLATTFGR